MTRISNTRPEPPQGPVPRRQEHKPRITRQRAKRMSEDAEYNAVRDVYLRENPQCCWCLKPASQVHHIAGGIHRRKSLANPDTWLPVCDVCHEYIAAQPVKLQCLIKHMATDAAVGRCR